MRLSRSIWFILPTLLLHIEAHDAHAQWKNIAPNIVARPPSLFGAIRYHSGTIIAAIPETPICISSDDGKSWQLIATPYALGDEPHDVDIFDGKDAIIATYKSGLFITHDGGLTWAQTSLTTPLTAAKFIGSAKDIIVAAPFGYQLISHDAGVTWSKLLSSTSSGQNDVQFREIDRSIYALETNGFSGGGSFGHINSTKDVGTTWHESAGSFYTDSYSLALDPCVDSVVYVINEGNFFAGDDGFGHVFYSHNNGKTFTAVNPKVMAYYCGSIVSAPGGTLYLQTQTNDGILRSTDHGVTWKSIGGPSGNSDSRLVCCKDDNTIFAVDKSGSIWETTNSGGDSLAFIPGNGSLSVTPRVLFDTDTLHCSIDSIVRTLSFTPSGCIPPIITGWSFSGSDSTNYSASHFTQSSLGVTFTPKKFGDHNALLIIKLSNGKSDTITLKGYNDSKPFQYSFTPMPLFSGDTVTLCDSQIRKAVLKTSGCLPKIISQSVTGTDANDYKVLKVIGGSLASGDSVIIEFKPRAGGIRHGLYELVLSDGTKISVPLEGVGDNNPFAFSFNPPSLFTADTLYLCSATAEHKIFISVIGCYIPKVISQTISGAYSSDYTIIRNVSSSIDHSDSVAIDFKPTSSGLRPATFTLTFSDGSTINIPLQGFGIAPHQLTLSTADQITNAIGGTVDVPITISGLDHPEDVDLVLHFGKQLTYHGSHSSTNVQLDIPGAEWVGRSKLHISLAIPNTIAGYARFDVFNDSLMNSLVTFDSVTVLTAIAPCQYILPGFVTSTITPPLGCGVDIISRFIHLGIPPQLSIIPNPSSGEISIISTHDLGEVSIAIYDMLGMQRGLNRVIIRKNNPAKLTLPEANGVYNVRVRSAERAYDLRVVLNR